MKRAAINASIVVILGLGIGLALLWLLGDAPPATRAQGPDGYSTYYVAPSCAGAPAPCYTTVQAAVDATDDQGDVIKVAAGTYSDVQGRAAPAGYDGPSVVIQVVYIDKTVNIQGGYTTAFTDSPNPEANPTVLNAQQQGRVVFVAGNISPTIEGLRITEGDATGLGGLHNVDVGGGVYIHTAMATFSNNQVFGNGALEGGGIHLEGSGSILNGNIIDGNTARDGHGGGLYLSNSAATLSGNTVSGNSAWRGHGGGLCLSNSPATLTGNRVSANVGGGLYLLDSAATLSGNTISANADRGLYLVSSDATLSGNTISGNTISENIGGGLLLDNSAAMLNDNIVSANSASSGGGLYLLDSAATLSGNTVTSNTAYYGGGLVLSGGSNTLSDNIISFNTATEDGHGGGLYLSYSTATLSGNDVSFNTASSGGGVDLYSSDATLTNNIISANTAVNAGGGLSISYSDASLSGNIVTSNTVAFYGGGLHVSSSDAIISGNTISYNTADWGVGGGLHLEFSPATLNGNTISANSARYSGGGISLQHSGATLNGNAITSNIAHGYGDWDGGGGLYLTGVATLTNNLIADNQSSRTGNGLYLQDSWDPPQLLHNTIARNHGGDGSGIYVGSYAVAMTNTILVGHTLGIRVTDGNTVKLEGTLWGSGAWANDVDWGGGGSVVIGTVNLWENPAFVDPAAGDYHIIESSAAKDSGIDAGVTIDIDGQSRPYDGSFDIGADEFHPEPELNVTKQASLDRVQPGAQLTYTIQVANTGNTDLHATITDTLPFSVTMGGTLIPPGGTLVPPGRTVILPDGRVAVTWTAFITAPDSLWTGTIVVTIDEGYEEALTNLVEVTTEEGAVGKAIAVVYFHKVYLPLVVRRYP